MVPIDPLDPDLSIIRNAAALIRDGGLVAFPTQSLYGIGADIYQPDSVSRVFHAKRRPKDKPISVLVGSESRLSDLASDVPEPAYRLMKRFWPGGLTIVFAAHPSVPSALTGNTGKIGVRLPAHPVAVALLDALDHPMTGTSANLSGHPGCSQISALALEVMSEMAIILDAGPLIGGAGSTVVDVTKRPPKVLREGGVSYPEIRDCIK
ncbi:MAG: threonylcarbamoyl-AMP synthase [Desulfobacterales bacterium]|nr:threonylcarbamoyl-AMP synthase [Desulfobacterales bacterium]